jgi:hypothetical protein
MSETVKKTTGKAKTTRKPKAEGESVAAAKPGKKATATNGHASNVTEMRVSHELVAQLAHRFWSERGYKHGYDAEDWFRAEQELRSKAS